MSYTINNTVGKQITVVADGTVDATLDLKLIGKNYAGYGAIQNENFVYLLENFSNTNPPPKPITGQIWFDLNSNKLKFFDANGKFRTTGGAEISSTAPSGLTQGDFWWNPTSQQLYTYNGTTFTLIGPQAVSGSATTQMRSVSLTDRDGQTHAVIEAIDNGTVIFIISTVDFILDTTINPITGFTKIHQGVTLCYTDNDDSAHYGVTSSSHRFFGTSTNADKLGGLPATSFARSDSASFSAQVNFGDPGFTIGNPVARLAIYNSGALTPTIQNQINDTIQFQTTVSSVTKFPLTLKGADVLPGVRLQNNLGGSTMEWKTVYAQYFDGTAKQTDALSVDGNYRQASTSAQSNSIAARDSAGNLTAANFNGTATSAYYADLAEKYLADQDYEPGTVVAVGGEKEVTACQTGDLAIGVVSANPAFKMNSELEGGTYIALKGRVPVKVIGAIVKGQRLVTGDNGIAEASGYEQATNVFAVALESNEDTGIKFVECVIL